MKNKRIKEAGFIFGKVCCYLGILGLFASCVTIPSDLNNSVNLFGIIMFAVSAIMFTYGNWRTGGKL